MPAEVIHEQPSTEQPFFAQGIPVKVDKIQRELKKLWQDSHETATRASRLNLVIFSDAEHSLRANTALVEQITRQHALRAILIAAKPHNPETRVRSWVNAHCQISKSGQKQRCSEQIAFQLDGEAWKQGLVPNIIFSNLDSDLPLYLWRQGEFSDTPSETLMAWVDCLIYDSADWPKPAAQFAIVDRLAAAANIENTLTDLNWTRLAGLRAAISQQFDAPGAQEALAELDSLHITHAPGARTEALLLAGWLASSLGWQPLGGSPWRSAGFQAANARQIAVTFQEQDGAGISRVELGSSDGSRFEVSHDAKSNFFNTSARLGQDGHILSQVLPVGAEDKADLVSAELVHGGGHRAYRDALKLVGGWLE